MTQAQIVRAMAIYTWDGYNPNEIDGRLNPRDFDDACEVAQTLGGVKVRELSSENHEYLFPDGSTIVIIVNAHGVGIGIEGP